jgi:hypothetical protein
MDGIDVSALIANGAPWSLIALGIVAILRGDIVPRKAHNDLIGQRDQVIRDITQDRDYYREQTLALLRVADTAADRMTQALLQRQLTDRQGQANDR